MILGVGHDLIEIERILDILSKPRSERFLRRILTMAEYELFITRKATSAEFAAGRFAAKEAVVKALGCGIGHEVGFHDIEILPDCKGKPTCTLSGNARKQLELDNSVMIHISITHIRQIAAAYAVVEQR